MNQRVRLTGNKQAEVNEVRRLLDKKPAALGGGKFVQGTRGYELLLRIRTNVLQSLLDELESPA